MTTNRRGLFDEGGWGEGADGVGAAVDWGVLVDWMGGLGRGGESINLSLTQSKGNYLDGPAQFITRQPKTLAC